MNSFTNNLNALARAVQSFRPDYEIHKIGQVGNSPVYGALKSCVGIAEVNQVRLEEVLKGFTEHWMAVFGPLIVLVALFGRRGIAGWLEALDRRRPSANPPAIAPAAPAPGRE